MLVSLFGDHVVTLLEGRLSYSKRFLIRKACTMSKRWPITIDLLECTSLPLGLFLLLSSSYSPSLWNSRHCSCEHVYAHSGWPFRVHRRRALANRQWSTTNTRQDRRGSVCLAAFWVFRMLYQARRGRSPLTKVLGAVSRISSIDGKRSYTLHLRIEIWLLLVFLDFLRNGDSHESPDCPPNFPAKRPAHKRPVRPVC